MHQIKNQVNLTERSSRLTANIKGGAEVGRVAGDVGATETRGSAQVHRHGVRLVPDVYFGFAVQSHTVKRVPGRQEAAEGHVAAHLEDIVRVRREQRGLAGQRDP